ICSTGLIAANALTKLSSSMSVIYSTVLMTSAYPVGEGAPARLALTNIGGQNALGVALRVDSGRPPFVNPPSQFAIDQFNYRDQVGASAGCLDNGCRIAALLEVRDHPDESLVSATVTSTGSADVVIDGISYIFPLTN